MESARPKHRIVGSVSANTSPDLPEMTYLDAKVNVGMQAGVDPDDAPEMFYQNANVIIQTYAGTSPDLPANFLTPRVWATGQGADLHNGSAPYFVALHPG